VTKADQKEFAKTVIGVADSFKDYVLKQLRSAWERADLIERRASILKNELENVAAALESGAIDPDTARADMYAAGILPVLKTEEDSNEE
jgi:serine phosphatase RsbU (regulator of sigma subunit)